MKTVNAYIHSLKNEKTGEQALGEALILEHKDNNNVIAEYNGVKCSAIFNVFVGRYYIDDVYGIIGGEKQAEIQYMMLGNRKIIKYSENEAKEYAKNISKTVVIRSFENGSSDDNRRESTAAEAELVERAIAAALVAIRAGYNADSAKATAEFFILHNSGETHINTYDSVYIPINDFLEAQATDN
jgi:hypothetical protein